MPAPVDVLARRLRFQAAACHELGSPFYSALLEAAADDLERGGAVARLLEGFETEPGGAALALRLMAAVHRLVLVDDLPELARHYPSTGGDGDAAAAWPLFLRAVAERPGEIRSLMTRGCQTNEVGRSAALLGGFLEIARRTKLPLRLLEIGASAGLNLRWDRYRYESARGAWGPEDAHVRFTHSFTEPPPLDVAAEVAERLGCDLQPIDASSEEGALTLRSFVWADQLGRLAQLDGAIEIAADVPVEVERIAAGEFLERELRVPAAGVATAVYHSVFVQYLPENERHRILDAIESGRARSTRDSPVHHLQMEPGPSSMFEIRLDGELLATSRAHGTDVRWLVR